MNFRILCLSFLFLLNFCDLENRYPEAGEFCTPMREIPECVSLDFRKKEMSLNGISTEINMVNRVQYEKIQETQKLEIDVLSEHRIRIQTKNLPDLSLLKEEIYIRKKGPKVSIWQRFQNWRNSKSK